MDVEDDGSLSSLIEFDGEVEGTQDIVASEILEASRNELIVEDSIDLSELAKSILDDCHDPHVSAEELIMTSCVNTKKYEKTEGGIENRFFDTIDKYGGDQLRKLSFFAMDGFKEERLFYIKLRGERSEAKRFILNKCLVKVAIKWHNNDPKSAHFGMHLQPSTWLKMMKYLFSVFHKNNIQYNYLTDFNGDGEFHAVLTTLWANEHASNPTFATGINTATFDHDSDLKHECSLQ
jgi:hypothetical protein